MTAKIRELKVDDIKNVSGGVAIVVQKQKQPQQPSAQELRQSQARAQPG